jgi:RNA polymerase sigma factor (sigma-70 family)
MRDQPTAQLLAAIKEGNTAAFSTLFNRYRTWLERWTRGRLPAFARRGVDTRDVVQVSLSSVFARVLQPGSLRSDAALRGYLKSTIENRIRDLIRQAERRPPTLPISEAECVAFPADRQHSDQSDEALLSALRSLSNTDRTALVARHVEEYSYEQIGAVLGKSAGAARMIVERAANRLVREMARVDARR